MDGIETVRFGDGELTLSSEAEELQVNTWEPSSQHDPSITGLADGNYVVTWQDDSGHDGGSGADIRGQVFTPSGAPLGEEFRVNTTTYQTQSDPSIASLSDGGFVITWESDYQDGDSSYYNIYGQRFDANGSSVGDEFMANVDRTIRDQHDPSVTGLDNGEFVITWSDESTSSRSSELGSGFDNSDWAVFGQKFTTVGGDTPSTDGDLFQVNTYTSSNQYNSGANSGEALASLSDGGFVKVWESYNQDGDGGYYNIYGQQFDASGNTVGDEFMVNADRTVRDQHQPSVAGLDNGEFVVTWGDEATTSRSSELGSGFDNSGWAVFGQKFTMVSGTDDDTPVPNGDLFQANTYTSSTQYDATVTSLGSDGFVVTWAGYNQDGHEYGIFAQRYDTSGVPVGDEFQVSTETYQSQQDPVVTALADGSFVVAWESEYQDNNGSSDWGIFSQHFDADGTRASDAKLIGGSGDETLIFDAAQDGLAIDLGDGIDTLTLGAGDDSIAVANTETLNLGDGDDMAVVTGDNLAHQTDVVKLSGTIETGDVYTVTVCLLYTSPSPRDATLSRMPSSA